MGAPMSASRSKYGLVIVDGRHLLHRGNDVHPDTESRDGKPAGGIYGFLVSLAGIIQRHGGPVAVAWEGRDNFRYTLYPAYKSARHDRVPPELTAEMHESLKLQEGRLQHILRALGIPQYRGVGGEADDVMATLATMAVARGETVLIYTGDSDLRQLVGPGIVVAAPATGKDLGDKVYATAEDVEARHEVAPCQLADLKALAGDTSDSIPGVVGVGNKTAAALLKVYGTVEAVVASASNGRVGWPEGTRFAKAADSIKLAAPEVAIFKRLTTLRRDLPLFLIAATAPNRRQAAAYLAKLGLSSFTPRLGEIMAGV